MKANFKANELQLLGGCFIVSAGWSEEGDDQQRPATIMLLSGVWGQQDEEKDFNTCPYISAFPKEKKLHFMKYYHESDPSLENTDQVLSYDRLNQCLSASIQCFMKTERVQRISKSKATSCKRFISSENSFFCWVNI